MQVLDIISKGGVKGIAHITGGGFTDNIPRVFPKGLGALIYEGSWTIPPVFKWIQEVIPFDTCLNVLPLITCPSIACYFFLMLVIWSLKCRPEE